MDAVYNYRTPIFIHNSSAEPIYEVVTGIVFIQGAGAPRTLEGMLETRSRRREEASKIGGALQVAWGRGPVATTGIVPPGTWRVWIQGKGWTSVLSGRGCADVAFVDRAGASWVRRAMGPLEELPTRPLEHFGEYGLDGPYDFQEPESANDFHRVEPDITNV